MVREMNLSREFYEDICICIPTRRPPPIRTLESYPPQFHKTFVIADPDVLAVHQDYYSDVKKVTVVPGTKGMGAQSYLCYRVAHKNNFKIFFRMDDDLPPQTFLHKDGRYPVLEEVIDQVYTCLLDCDVSLAGFTPTSNRNWLGFGFKRSYGIVHGGANLAYSCEHPNRFIDPTLSRCEDIYRTCAHREEDRERGYEGSTGRVSHLGFDKSKSTSKKVGKGNVSTIQINREQVLRNRQLVLERFGNMIAKLDDDGVRFRKIPT